MEAIAFQQPPLTLEADKLSISLDKLNQELSEYKIRVDSLTDIFIDKEASAINTGSVLKINAVYINPVDKDGFDDLFFNGYLEMEDKFEALHGVYSAEFDPAELIMTIGPNSQNVVLNTTLQAGGAVADPTTEALVDQQMSANAKEVFDLVGIAPPTDDADALVKVPQVRQKAIEHYRRLKPQALFVFYGGQKMDIAPGAGFNVMPLQTELTKRLYDVIGAKLTAPDHQMQTLYANNKAILAIDMLRGEAQRSTEPVFHITEDLINDVVQRVQEKTM